MLNSAVEILERHVALQKIVEGAAEVAMPVSRTMGARGSEILISKSYGSAQSTKDGVTVAKSITSLGDHRKNEGAKLIKAIAEQTNESAGDGTTSTIVIGCEVLKNIRSAVMSGLSERDLRKGMGKAISEVEANLASMAMPIKDDKQIRQIAMVSANGDVELGGLIADAIAKVGKNGVITIEESKSNETELIVKEGMNFDRGYISNYFVTDTQKSRAELEKPYVLITDKKISSINQIIHVLEQVVQSGKSLLVIADDVDGEALTTLVVNKLRGSLKVVAVKAPGFGDRRKALLEDIAILSGGQLISEDLGHKLEDVTLNSLGQVHKAIVSKDETTIVANDSSVKNAIEERCKQIKNEIAESNSSYDKSKLEERLARLAGGIAIIRVGGDNEMIMKERKDRLEDAKNAAKAALEEGAVPGGGKALLECYANIDINKLVPDSLKIAERVGAKIILDALKAPITQILRNAGLDSSVIIDKLMAAKQKNKIFDVISEDFVDAYEAGIIDPLKVIRLAFKNAAKMGESIVSTAALIVNKPAENKNSAPSMGGMAGGPGGMMDDMDF